MGIITNYYPGCEKLYHEVKKIKKFFDPCKDFIKEAWDMLKGKSVENDPKKKAEHDKKQAEIQEKKRKGKESIDKLEQDDKENQQKKEEFCSKTKKILEKIYKIAVEDLFEKKSKNEKDSKILAMNMETPENYCDFPTYSAKALESIKEEFETEDKEEFKKICVDFKANNNCHEFSPDNTGAWNFIKKTVKYSIFIKDGASCVVNLLKKGGKHEAKGIPENPKITKLADDAFGAWSTVKVIAKELGSLILQILSFGIWGVIRAAWNLLCLGKNIMILAMDVMADFPFQIGKLVGLVIKIVKALVAGRRRRLK